MDSTNKVSLVFNRSLNSGGSPYLNKASYGGINLIAELLGLLIHFRTNEIAVPADIAKTFRKIKVNKLTNNKFSFIVYQNKAYVHYRYTTIIFRFVTSPFILNYIIQHHASFCTNLSINEALSSNYTSITITTLAMTLELPYTYKSVKAEAAKGNFCLREWCSNNTALKVIC